MVVRIRVYLAVVFLSITLLILAAAFWFLFDFLQKETTRQIVSQQQSTVVSAAAGIDLEAYAKLVKLLDNPNLSRETVDATEKSPEFRKISDFLNRIRDSQPSLYLYVYTLFPSDRGDQARFVVDADVLVARQNVLRGKNLANPISHFGQYYDLSGQPDTQRALREHKVVVNREFVEDEAYHTASMMAFAPIVEPGTGRFLGVLGIDISRENYSRFIGQLFLWGMLLLGLTGVVSVVISLVISTFLVRPIQALTADVLALSRQQLRTRSRTKSFILEIEDLSRGFNQMADSIEEKQNSLVAHNESMERFVPTEFLTFLHRQNHLQVALGDQILQNLTVMFSDLRGFTALSETLTPQQTIDFLNRYFTLVAPIIRDHNGFIDKFLGDGILSVFPGNPEDSVRAAMAMDRALVAFNAEAAAAGRAAIRIGTAIHYGPVMLGTVGEVRRLQTTVISDVVNTASRLEGMNNYLGTSLLLSGAAHDALAQPDDFSLRFLGGLAIRGKKDGVRAYEVLDALPEVDRQSREATRSLLQALIDQMEQGRWKDAHASLSTFQEADPTDRLSQYFARQLRALEHDLSLDARS